MTTKLFINMSKTHLNIGITKISQIIIYLCVIFNVSEIMI